MPKKTLIKTPKGVPKNESEALLLQIATKLDKAFSEIDGVPEFILLLRTIRDKLQKLIGQNEDKLVKMDKLFQACCTTQTTLPTKTPSIDSDVRERLADIVNFHGNVATPKQWFSDRSIWIKINNQLKDQKYKWISEI